MEPASSTTPKYAANNDDSPILSLPADILAKIIAYVPIAQWPCLELLKDFHDATRIAWRQLRNINLDRELLFESEESSLAEGLEYLVERSPYLTSLSGIDLCWVDSNSDVIRSLAKFEYLQSITMGDAQCFEWDYSCRSGVQLDALVEFLETTRSRTTLKQLQVFNVKHKYASECVRAAVHAASLDRFHSSLVNVRELIVNGNDEWTEIRRPFKLEKFLFSTDDPALYIRLDTLDATCLTDLRLGATNVGILFSWGERHYDRRAPCVDPVQLISLIERAENLRRIEFFLTCGYDCRQRVQENRQVLAALGRHKNLTTIKFDFGIGGGSGCNLVPDVIQMLRSIGHRGQLRKLVLPDTFRIIIHREEIYSTIHAYIPYLQSIQLSACIVTINPEIVDDIASMTELEELHFSYDPCAPLHHSHISKISQLHHLKRLAFFGTIDVGTWRNSKFVDPWALELLANATTLSDLRIRYAPRISSDVFEKWGDGFGSNLQILMLNQQGESYWAIDAESDEDERDLDYEGQRDQYEEAKRRQYEKDKRHWDEGDKRAEVGLIRLLEKAVRLRILILDGRISDRSMMAIAKSCPHLEILGVRSAWNAITSRGLQEIVNRCTKLRRLGGISDEIRNQLEIPKYRKIGDVDMNFWMYDFDDPYYE